MGCPNQRENCISLTFPRPTSGYVISGSKMGAIKLSRGAIRVRLSISDNLHCPGIVTSNNLTVYSAVYREIMSEPPENNKSFSVHNLVSAGLGQPEYPFLINVSSVNLGFFLASSESTLIYRSLVIFSPMLRLMCAQLLPVYHLRCLCYPVSASLPF